MSKYTEFFLNGSSSLVQLETFEISHPGFDQTYRIVRNSTKPILVTLEDSSVVEFTYLPVKITVQTEQQDLEYSIKFELGDLGTIIPVEISNAINDDGSNLKASLIYRIYRSDDLQNIMLGPIQLEIKQIAFNKQGCVFEARAPSLNVVKTGELYSITRFPMLRGFL